MKKNIFLLFTSTVFLVSLGGCEKTVKKQVEKALQDNPELLFNAIKSDPKKFFDTVRAASMEMNKVRRKQQSRSKDEIIRKAIEQGFNKPKKPDLSKNRTFFGDKKAPITIVEYSDYHCPFCKRGAQVVHRVLKEYKGKVRVLYKHFPIKPLGLPAAKYYEAVALQSFEKAKMFHDKVFENQSDLSQGREEFLKKMAKEVGGLNLKKLEKDINSKKVADLIEKDRKEAQNFGITGTPSFVINGSLIQGAYGFEDFKLVIDKHLEKIESKKNES